MAIRKKLNCPKCGMELQLLGIGESRDETTATSYPRYYFFCTNCNTEILMAEYTEEAAEAYADYIENPNPKFANV